MRRRETGFTLLEMMVALVVFGLLMAGLSQTMRYGLTAWTAETHAANGGEDMATVDMALRRLVEQAAPTGFTGTATGFACTTTLPAGSGLGDRLADIALVLGPDQTLLLRWTPHPAGIPLGPAPVPQTETLLRGVTGLRIGFLTAQPGAGPVWADTYTGGSVPLLVRIGIQFADHRMWPDLVAGPIVPAS